MNIILPDIVAAGIYNTDLAIKNKTVTKNRKTTMFEIEIPIERGGHSYINSGSHSIVPDIIVCAKPGQTRHTELPYKCYYIHFIVNEGMLYDILVGLPDYIEITDPKKYYAIFKKISSHYQTGVKNAEIILQSLILELVYRVSTAAGRQKLKHKSKRNNFEAIEKTIAYIKDNLTSDLTLSTISEYISFSPVYLHNLFKASTGKTIHEYVEEQRLAKAINLLTTTDMTLTQIAYECGFSSQAYFSYAFKRKMKMPPKLYAKKIIERYDL